MIFTLLTPKCHAVVQNFKMTFRNIQFLKETAFSLQILLSRFPFPLWITTTLFHAVFPCLSNSDPPPAHPLCIIFFSKPLLERTTRRSLWGLWSGRPSSVGSPSPPPLIIRMVDAILQDPASTAGSATAREARKKVTDSLSCHDPKTGLLPACL